MKKKREFFVNKLKYQPDKAHFRIQNYNGHSLFFDNVWELPEQYKQDNSVFNFKRSGLLSYPSSLDVIDLREVIYEYIDNKILPYPRYNAGIFWNPNGYLAACLSRYKMYKYRSWSHVTFWIGMIDDTGIKGLWFIV